MAVVGEFDLIERFFAGRGPRRGDVRVGIGDDGALLDVPHARDVLAVAVSLPAGGDLDTTDPRDLGRRALSAALSQLADRRAQPAWVTLSLTLPRADPGWLQAFSEDFFELVTRHDVALVGGDTTRGPLSVTVVAHGLVPKAPARTC